ncbi:hypothetical protein Ahy_B09g098628 [Arachis hypogaea]|uniref:Aminotransferase-like plant mobile domain-containing protein n=1 Tax=Arachis hypogaea TaxID=3818 RepID=A0A444XSD8_ARAHY|nr:hypothetical protein Ahy_B09g098628 [Arachis hypogaea]
MKLTWFQNTNCGELEQDATEERLMRYTRGCIMQLIEGILFPDASDSRVHIRWLLLLEDLERCGQSPSMAVLPDVSGHGAWPTQFGRLLGGWHELWDARVHHHLPIHHHIDLRSSLSYMTWYLQWAHMELFGLGDQHLVAAEVVPEDLPMHHPLAPDLHQPDDGHLLEMRPAARGGRGRGGGEPGEEVGAVLGTNFN